MRVRGVVIPLALSVDLLTHAVTEFQNVIQDMARCKVLIAKFLGMITGVYYWVNSLMISGCYELCKQHYTHSIRPAQPAWVAVNNPSSLPTTSLSVNFRGFSPQANYTDRATAAYWRS
jgi:hypothetical protein